ncbi:MAG: (deoxy)nucleoside triphosphate pyrophosphohydrolase [Spirochaetaceae bacterium]
MKHLRVTAAVIERDGRFLICRRRQGGELPRKWEFPGGKIEPGESETDCLSRELREELSVEARPRRRLGTVEQERPDGRLELIAWCTDIGASAPVLGDHEELAWVRPEDLGGYDLAPADEEIAKWIAFGHPEG